MLGASSGGRRFAPPKTSPFGTAEDARGPFTAISARTAAARSPRSCVRGADRPLRPLQSHWRADRFDVSTPPHRGMAASETPNRPQIASDRSGSMPPRWHWSNGAAPPGASSPRISTTAGGLRRMVPVQREGEVFIHSTVTTVGCAADVAADPRSGSSFSQPRSFSILRSLPAAFTAGSVIHVRRGSLSSLSTSVTLIGALLP